LTWLAASLKLAAFPFFEELRMAAPDWLTAALTTVSAPAQPGAEAKTTMLAQLVDNELEHGSGLTGFMPVLEAVFDNLADIQKALSPPAAGATGATGPAPTTSSSGRSSS
jgi:hypothetical protein